MNSGLQNRIFQAQCFGNVEPIEFMVPYPNIFSLVEGENIKFEKSILYSDISITNKKFYDICNRAASWLEQIGVASQTYIFLPNLPFPYGEIMAFGIWNLGGIVVISDTGLLPNKSPVEIKNILPEGKDYQELLSKSNPNFTPRFKPNLLDEAMIYLKNDIGFRFSHYNLLVNANGIQKSLNLQRGTSIKVNLTPTTTAWAILQLILPLYSGTSLTHKTSDKTFGLPGQFKNPDYLIQKNWSKIEKTIPPSLFILSENSGAVSINEEAIHLTEYKIYHENIQLNGHSVMMGYTDDKKNEKCFINNSFILENFSN